MTVTYELNPPKVIQDTVLSHQQLQESVNKLKTKALEVSNVCNSIHVTDSVLGIPRISPIKIVDKLKPQGFRIIPCILLPSEKNLQSAKRLNLDWSNYSNDVVGFIKEAHKISGNVLISSPNDFKRALEILKKLT